MGWRRQRLEIKTPAQVDAMRAAGLVVAETLVMLRELARPGLSTAELDAAAEAHIRDLGAVPSFLGYQGFTGSICVSVNDEVVHGVPGQRVLAEGDLVSIDCGAIVAGWHGDAAISVTLGEVPPEVTELVRVTEAALWAGVAAMEVGKVVADVSRAVEDAVRAAGGYGVVEEYTGHGIGTEMHLPPDVPNVAHPAGGSPQLVPGLALAVEPMVTLGSPHTDLLDDEWTAVTVDGSWAAHVEHTIALTPEGPWVLTALDGGRAALAERGVRCGAR